MSQVPFVCSVEPSAPGQSAELAPYCAAATHGEAVNQLKKNCVSSDMFARNEEKGKFKKKKKIQTLGCFCVPKMK